MTQGALRIVQEDGGIVECPLKHTDVKADVSGFIARVKVTQTFHNPTKEKIEAVYVFPLPHEAAVDDMTMVVGERKIVGLIKRRQEARAIYEQALAAGQTAALLEQERPNIFTQSVGNIEPGQEVKIEISYVDVLRYDVGTYEFHFPMVVGPRYIPGAPSGGPEPRPANLQGKVSPPVADTDRVPDASRHQPAGAQAGLSQRARYLAGRHARRGRADSGSEGVPTIRRRSRATARARRRSSSPADSLPNKDFVLRYGVVGKKPEMAVLAHTGNYTDTRRLGNGYFMLMIQPKEDERLTKSPPREIVFLVDVSGPMSGEPTAKVIEAMQSMLKLCRPAGHGAGDHLRQPGAEAVREARAGDGGEHSAGVELHRRPARRRRHRNAQGRAAGHRRADRQRAAADRRHAHRRLHRQRGRDHRARRQALRRPGALLVRRHRLLAQHVPGRRRGQARRRHGQEAGPARTRPSR